LIHKTHQNHEKNSESYRLEKRHPAGDQIMRSTALIYFVSFVLFVD